MARLGRNRRRHRKVSAPVPPEDKEALSYQWERFHLISNEFPALFKRHWDESGSLKETATLDINWDHYFQSDLAGRLALLTVRCNSILVGYAFVFDLQNPHHMTTRWAHIDKMWLDPVYRRGFAGVRLIREIVRHMDGLDAKIVTCGIPLMQERITNILRRYGFAPVETIFARVKP